MNTSRPPALVVTDASRRIDGRDVLAGASLSVAAGTIVSLLGPNGAGKSSLLRAIAGRLALDGGHVMVDGVPAPDARRGARIGVVPQDIALFNHLTVRENLSVLGRLAGVPPRDLARRVDEGMHWAGLAERGDAIVTTLSGGMRRRVNLVAGTLHRPALLLLDEPTVGVDADARARLHDLLKALRAQGMGLLLATHDAEEASFLCDEVALMAAGRVIVRGTVASVIDAAFGGRREVTVTLAHAPTPQAVACLLAEQFHRDEDCQWVSRVGGPGADLVRLAERLGQAGTPVVETRVTEPHLRGAVAMLLDRASREAAA